MSETENNELTAGEAIGTQEQSKAKAFVSGQNSFE